MSIFDTANSDAYTMPFDQASRGPQLGFQDAFMASWEAQTKTQSLLGVQQMFRNVEQEQIKKIREAGLTPPPSLDESEERSSGPFGSAQFYQGRYAAAAQSLQDGGGWYTDDLVKERDDAIKKLQQERPDLGLRTYGEMFGEVQQKGKEAMERNALPTTTLGTVGGFLGGAAASLNPVSDPLNFASFVASAPMGGPTVLQRVGVQAGVGAIAEAGNIAVGPDNQRIITGVPTSTNEELARLGMAAAGGAGGQLFGEAIGMGARRLTTGKWFADVAPDKLPTREVPPMDDQMRAMVDEMSYGVERKLPPDRPFKEYPDFEAFARSQDYDLGNPYGPSRQAALRHASDLDYVAGQLDRWDGPMPHDVPSRSDLLGSTASAPGGSGGVRYEGVWEKYVSNIDDVDTIARRIDKDLFDLYDKLELQRLEMSVEISRQQERFRTFSDPETMFEGAAERHRADDMARRQELQKIDYQMRDLAPLVSRAYAAAESEWKAGAASDFAVQNFLKGVEERTQWRYRGDDRPSLTEQPMRPRSQPPLTTVNQADILPNTMLTPAQEAKLRPGQHDAIDRVAAVSRGATESAEANVDTFMTATRKVSRLDGAEWVKAKDVANDKLIEAKQRLDKAAPEAKESAAEAVKKAQQEVDDLTGITMPDGKRLDFNDTMIDADGNTTTVRKFIQDMDADTEAFSAVRTCSIPSSPA